MQSKFVVCDPGKCVGCGICELACSAEKEKSFNPLFSRIRSVRLDSIKEPLTSIAFACFLCEDPACVKSCPREALSVNEEDGTILVDEVKCNGCGLCIAACEFGAMSRHPEKNVASVCDLCKDEPKCVEACPKGALYFDTIDEVIRKSEVDVVKPLLLEFENSRTHSKTFYKREGFLVLPYKKNVKDQK